MNEFNVNNKFALIYNIFKNLISNVTTYHNTIESNSNIMGLRLISAPSQSTQ